MSESPRVLIVEDATDGNGQLASMLAAAGFVTRLAADDEDALVHLDGWQPAAVVVDLRVQQQAGRRFCAALAQRTEGERTEGARTEGRYRPIVLIGETANLMKRLPLAPAGLVSTPFEAEQLVVTVRRVTAGAVRELVTVN